MTRCEISLFHQIGFHFFSLLSSSLHQLFSPTVDVLSIIPSRISLNQFYFPSSDSSATALDQSAPPDPNMFSKFALASLAGSVIVGSTLASPTRMSSATPEISLQAIIPQH